MPLTLSLSCSKKLYELLGPFETEKYWSYTGVWRPRTKLQKTRSFNGLVPAPSFSETIRLLPRIAEKIGRRDMLQEAEKIGFMYMIASNEEEGMKQVSDYLEALL